MSGVTGFSYIFLRGRFKRGGGFSCVFRGEWRATFPICWVRDYKKWNCGGCRWEQSNSEFIRGVSTTRNYVSKILEKATYSFGSFILNKFNLNRRLRRTIVNRRVPTKRLNQIILQRYFNLTGEKCYYYTTLTRRRQQLYLI